MSGDADGSTSAGVAGVRPDGRPLSGSTLRPLSCELSTLHNSDGSCLWKSGSTHVLASVHGPVAPRQPQHESSRGATVSVVIKSGIQPSGASATATAATSSVVLDREWEDIITRTLSACVMTERYPRCVIQVVVQVLSADGSVLAASLHASVAALFDAGIEMTAMPVATTCLLLNSGGGGSDSSTTIRIDPCAEEERADDAGMVVVITETTHHPDRILGMHTSGISSNVQTLLKCCSVAERAAPAVTAFWRLAVEQKATRESQTLWSS